MRTVRRSLYAAGFALLLSLSTFADAGFFSRIVQFNKESGKEGGDKKAPAGAASAMGSEAQVGSVISFEDGIPLAHLANNNRIPLVGVGVGNLPYEFIPRIVSEALQENKRTRLIDTAHASQNEALVALGINDGVQRLGADEKVEVHVVTKVWYTHLGYERTKHSVEESLRAVRSALDNDKVDLKLHILLHWPRCFDQIPWMNCERDEMDLPEEIRRLGPDPNKDPENAWKESWKLLEDMYLSDKYPIASIGVSNFHLRDVELMDTFARIHPHILQVNLWSLLYDPLLIEYSHKHKIHLQVYNALHSTMSRPETAPRAYHHLQKVAIEISNEMGQNATPSQVILAWLIQHGVSVIPRTQSPIHLLENSALSLANFPAFSDHQVETVAHSVEAYLSGDDLEQDLHVSVTFHADTKDMVLYWLGHDGEETRIKLIRKGDSFDDTTYPKHKFRSYLATNKDVYVEHEIDANFGEHKHIHVEL